MFEEITPYQAEVVGDEFTQFANLEKAVAFSEKMAKLLYVQVEVDPYTDFNNTLQNRKFVRDPSKYKTTGIYGVIALPRDV